MSYNEEVAKQVGAYAVQNFKSGLNCSESVFDALVRAGVLDVPPESIAMCIGFGGGIGLSGTTCGALSAAVMANGAVYGRKDPYAVDSTVRGSEIADKYYRRYNKMVEEFTAQNNGVTCAGITGHYADWECKERRIQCMKLVGKTAELAYKYLQIPQEEAFALPYGKNMKNEK
ncbi:MAG TPA: C_GCAxxG_C_C family protein [Candidatus Avacidaminococcus intestinavium]|uniref:C_GCAxxG_C_C family protein n=1 Tax=Candidatus Avacidaminococcus intestinavium TaxID=2840684 RepID=A0A9D1SLN3_9FIRM|nr:C_GCAxxG_C_C family protein [Candidatus Avacidaminococcus intestinavium]